MKIALSALLLIFLVLRSSVSHAVITNYLESGYNQEGDTFRVQFGYDNILGRVTSISGGSFIDLSGAHTGMTTILEWAIPDGYGKSYVITNKEYTDLGYYALQFDIINRPSINRYPPFSFHFIPTPGPITLAIDPANPSTTPPYGGDWIPFEHISISAAPEPEEWLMILAGLPLIGWVTRRKQKQQ